MPKKRISSLYTKPPSTAHPSLNSGGTSAGSSNQQNAQPSVNDLIKRLRGTQVTASNYAQLPPTFSSQTLPPQTRSLLALPETPAPRPRYRNGRVQGAPFRPGVRRVPGPAPPGSWLEGSRYAPPELRNRQPERLYPTELGHLPGLPEYESGTRSRRLQDVCLRTVAHDWEFISEYERNNLADLPTSLRIRLLSAIALYGPEEGVGFEGLKNLILFPAAGSEDAGEAVAPAEHNEGFYRLDLSGSIGRSINFRQLTDLVEKPAAIAGEPVELSWDETIARPLGAPLPHLTHLSLSHPPPTISWPKLLALAKHIPTLTHLSLAYWPVPALTPNAKTAVVCSKYSRDIQYGGTNYYSHSLDDDYTEAVQVLKKLAERLYGLEFLDLSGCNGWLRALSWHGGEEKGPGIDWSTVWAKLQTLRTYSGLELDDESTYLDALAFSTRWKQSRIIEEELHWWTQKDAVKRRKQYVVIEKDDPSIYSELWKGINSEESRKKINVIGELKARRREAPAHIVGLIDDGRAPIWEDW